MSQPTLTPELARITDDGAALQVSLVMADADVVAHARTGGLGNDPVETAKSLYRLGVVVTTTSRLDVTVAEARRMHDRLTALGALPDQLAGRISDRLGEQLGRLVGNGHHTGRLQQAIDASVASGATAMREELRPVIDQLVGSSPDALPQLVEARLRNAVTESTAAFQQHLFATESPLVRHLEQHAQSVAEVRGELGELRRELALQVAQLLRDQIDTAIDPADAGRDWEPAALDTVAQLTAITGDRLEITGNQPGHGRSKKGDGVLHLATDGRIAGVRVAIECRTGKSTRVTLADLEAAMENRAAHAALLLAEHPQGLPRDAEQLGFRIYPDDRIVVAHYDPTTAEAQLVLRAAIQVVRTLARLAMTAPTEAALELELMRTLSQRVHAAFAQLRPLRAAATGVERELGRVRECADRIHAELTAAIADLNSLGEAA